MAAQLDTSMQAEGSDVLQQFLLKHKNKLKNIEPIYNILHENDIDYGELMDYKESYLVETLNEIGMKKINIGRLINVLRKFECSTIFQEANKKTVVVLSNNEDKALTQLNKQSIMVSEFITNIKDEINSLNETYKKCEKQINATFDGMVEAINNRRKQLLKTIKNVTNDKSDKLNKQLNDLNIYKNALNESNIESQKLINDTNIHTIKRQTKILKLTQNVLNRNDAPNLDDFKLCACAML
eukprot:20075_1